MVQWLKMNVPPQPLRVTDLGRIGYRRALAEQLARVDALIESRRRGDEPLPAELLLCEHDPPTITLGRSARAENILAAPQALHRAGIEVHEASRGGDVTYHGPGQLTGYAILSLAERGRDLHRYLRDLEEVVLRVVADFGLDGRREDGRTGVWVGQEKVAAIGVAVRRWVSYHGFALNVCCEMEHFRLIVPCGIADKPVTSLSRLLDRPVGLEEVRPRVVRRFSEVFELQTQARSRA
jgi:lipoate-protein ligase B